MKLFSLFSFIFIINILFAQTKSVDIVIDSKVFNEERIISIFLPAAYNSEDSTSKFPVAYLFDGQFQPYFSMVSSIMSYYEQTNEGMPMIIVGVHSKNRWGEFVPICDGDGLNLNNGADKLTLFLKNDVIPLIESKYRVNDFKIGIGHSLGGTFVMNEIIKESSLFDAVIAVSPNLTICNEKIITDTKNFLINAPDNRRFIYTTVGNLGEMENDFRKSLLRLDSICKNMTLKNMYWNCQTIENHNHMTTFVSSFDAAYLALSSKLMLMDKQLMQFSENSNSSIKAELKSFYDERSKFYKDEQALSIDRIMEHATTLANYGKYDDCIELCQHAREILEVETITTEKKLEIAERIDQKQLRAEFNAFGSKAKKLANEGKFEEASALYIKAFDLELIQATHIVRMNAVPVLAQVGNMEEAFVQLDLLANKFKLVGNGQFIDDPLCQPLHKDKRWDELMDKLAKN